MQMIQKHYDLSTFWHDFVSCHYSRSVIKWYQQNGIDIVSKNMNPANMPQFCPNKKFWASMKCELCKKGKIVADINQFCQFGVWHHKIL